MNAERPIPAPPTVSRRAGLRLAAATALGAGLAAQGAGAVSAVAAGSDRRRLPEAGQVAYVTVTAATMWTEPGLARELDQPSLTDPVDLDAWNRSMPDSATRRWLTGKLESQALYGSRVIVDEVRDGWARIVAVGQATPRDARGYPGWVRREQLAVDDEYGRALDTARYALVVADRAQVQGVAAGRTQVAPFTATLPVVESHGRSAGGIAVRVPGGGQARVSSAEVEVYAQGEGPQRPTADQLIATGERFLGLRYLWAGMTPYGFDCSGFTVAICKRHGIALPRDAGPQMTDAGLPAVERADLRRGDLVFFATKPGGTSIRHVAVYLGDGRILQSPTAARGVEEMSLADYDPTGEYAGAVRLPLA